MPLDLSQADAAQRLYEEVAGRRRLKVTMLVANAGVGHTEAFLDAPFTKISELVNLNVLSLTQLVRLFGQDMAATGRGRIMTVSSIAGAAPGPLVSVYSATKAFVTSFTQALQHELEPQGVSVSCLVPGATFTEFSHTSRAKNAMAFTVPGLAMSAERVARAGVEGMLRGDVLVVPVSAGWARGVGVCWTVWLTTHSHCHGNRAWSTSSISWAPPYCPRNS